MGSTTISGDLRAAMERGQVRPASTLVATCDPEMTRRFLRLLRAPEVGCIELRVLRAGFDRRGQIRRAEDLGQSRGGSTLAGWFTDAERLAAQARGLRGVSAYVTANPVRHDLLARWITMDPDHTCPGSPAAGPPRSPSALLLVDLDS